MVYFPNLHMIPFDGIAQILVLYFNDNTPADTTSLSYTFLPTILILLGRILQ